MTDPEPAAARARFAEGAQAFAAGDYSRALAAFLAAREAGLSGPSVDYNIGVSAWRLGRLDDAEQAFLRVAQAPEMAPLAHYNLGLISLRRGDETAALRWFHQARDRTDDASLRQLAEVALARLQPARPVAPAARVHPRVFVALQGGYDDNVVLVSDGELLGISDTASPIVDGQIVLLAVPREGIQLEASAYLVEYTSLSEFSQFDGQLGIRYSHRVADWRGELGAHVGHTRLDGDALESRFGGSLSVWHPIGPRQALQLRYRFDDIDGREPYRSLSGTRHQAGLELRWSEALYSLRVAYLFETNDRDAASLSPDRHLWQVDWRLNLPRQLQARLGASLRRSGFDLDDGDKRSERRLLGAAELMGELQGGWQWTAGYDWTRNRADAAEFRYTRNRVMVGIQRVY